MNKNLTLGTAQIIETDGLVLVRFMTIGTFLAGEQMFGDSRQGWNAALRFCRERALRVVS